VKHVVNEAHKKLNGGDHVHPSSTTDSDTSGNEQES
jgi:hypothetical protein